MFGRRPGVDLGQQFLHPPQDAHLQRLILLGHQRRLVSGRFERRDRLHHRWEVYIPVLRPQWIDAHWPLLHPQPLHVALRPGIQLCVVASTCIRGHGVLVQMRLGSVVTLSVEGAVGRGQGSSDIQAPGDGRGRSLAGCPAYAGASRLWG